MEKCSHFDSSWPLSKPAMSSGAATLSRLKSGARVSQLTTVPVLDSDPRSA